MLNDFARTSCRLRPIAKRDARRILDWRNTPAIRRAMFTTGEIDWEGHLAWIERTIASKDVHAFIFEQAGTPLGYVNLERTSAGCVKWGFYIGAVGAPAGSGSRMLFLGLEEAFGPIEATRVEASVRPENAASLHIHDKLGFRRLDDWPEPVALRFDITRDAWHRARIALSEALFAEKVESGA